MKKTTIIIIVIAIIIIGAFLISFFDKENGIENNDIFWQNHGKYQSRISEEQFLVIRNSSSKNIVGKVSADKIFHTINGTNVLDYRYKLYDYLINPTREEIYFLINDKEAISGPYVGVSVYVVASDFNGKKIKTLALLEGYDLPKITLSDDGQTLIVEQLFKGGPSEFPELEIFYLDIVKLFKD